MVELLRTNDAVMLSYLDALLRGDGIESIILDTHTSVLEGSVGALPRRVMVSDDDGARARRLLDDVGISYARPRTG